MSSRFHRARTRRVSGALSVALLAALPFASAQAADTLHAPRCSADAAPDVRADCVLATLSTEQKLSLVFSLHGSDWIKHTIPTGSNGGAAWLPLPPQVGLPALQMSDAGMGVGNPGEARKGVISVSLPSGLATASTFDPELAFAAGAMVGEESHRQGFNVQLAGAINLTRDPRGGRNFEYAGEDPLLAGRMVGNFIAGIQSRHVISTIKHFALNDIETSRMTMNANLDEAAFRESDLLAFRIAIGIGHPGSVMCAYNRVNDVYACENRWLLTDVLKHDWGYPGFVMSDWGATHSTVRAALAGLDQESSGDTMDAHRFFAEPLADAIEQGKVPASRLDDMARRVLHSIYAVGLPEHPPVHQPIDLKHDLLVSRNTAEAGSVLLRNRGDLLPLRRDAQVAVIGGHADVGVLSGGGSGQVLPIGGNPVPGKGNTAWPGDPVYHPSSPLKAMRAEARGGAVRYASGDDIAAAVALARQSDVAVVFATQWSYESVDVPSLSLPDNQDALIAAVAAANPHTVVVLENNGPVTMPWLEQVDGVLESWYPGAAGGEAIARLLYGRVAPSGRLPMTFPKDTTQLPRPEIAGVTATSAFEVQTRTDQELNYNEGADAGYRWYDRNRSTPLFAFGHGLTYTRFKHSDFQVRVDHDGQLLASFVDTNIGKRAGSDVPQIYVRLPDGGARRLAGWHKLTLQPGEQRKVEITLDPRLLVDFDSSTQQWIRPAGQYTLWLGEDAGDDSLPTTLELTRIVRDVSAL